MDERFVIYASDAKWFDCRYKKKDILSLLIDQNNEILTKIIHIQSPKLKILVSEKKPIHLKTYLEQCLNKKQGLIQEGVFEEDHPVLNHIDTFLRRLEKDLLS